MKTQIVAVMAFLFTGAAFGQPFQRTIYNPEKDFNHYSIETTKTGYVCVGTLFDKDNNDIHIISLSNNGDVLWERIIDETEDDRGLDVVVDAADNIVLTGYISPAGIGRSNLYIAKLDLSGNYLGDRSLINIMPPWGFEMMTTGLNIIYSRQTNSYIVGGLTTSNMERPLAYNTGLLVAFDTNLNILNQRRIFTGSTLQSINDIVEIRGGYFITGGIERLDSRQGVLAAVVDFDLNLEKNFSFDDFRGDKHMGASVVYDKDSDDIYVLSNNFAYSNPQVTKLNNISDDLTWCDDDIASSSYLLVLDKDGYYSPAGYKLEPCLWNTKHLVASGYFNKRESEYGESGTIAWIIEFDKATGSRIAGMEWTVSPSNGFTDQGGVLSEYRFAAPLYYTQEMMTRRNDGKGYVMLAPRIIDKHYSLEIMTTDYMYATGCYEELMFEPYPIDLRHECIDQGNIKFAQYIPTKKQAAIRNRQAIFCEDGVYSERGVTASIENIEKDLAISVYPNPANESVFIELPTGFTTGVIQLIDLTGKVVIQRTVNTALTNVGIETLENGVYFIKYSDSKGKTYTSKFIKSS